jgi:DNA-binding MarR family transcriptional regulator
MNDDVDTSTGALTTDAAQRYAADLLELFYPIHYRGTMALEDAMRGDLTRKQAAILWLIRTAGSASGHSLRRKQIVVRLQNWFDVSSPAVTKALRSMARPPLGLVRQIEDPDSGREKRVLLTAKGERFLATMAERGCDFLHKITEQLREDQLRSGVEFLSVSIAAFERAHAQKFVNHKSPTPKRRRPARRLPDARPENGATGESFSGFR